MLVHMSGGSSSLLVSRHRLLRYLSMVPVATLVEELWAFLRHCSFFLLFRLCFCVFTNYDVVMVGRQNTTVRYSLDEKLEKIELVRDSILYGG